MLAEFGTGLSRQTGLHKQGTERPQRGKSLRGSAGPSHSRDRESPFRSLLEEPADLDTEVIQQVRDAELVVGCEQAEPIGAIYMREAALIVEYEDDGGTGV